MTQLATLLVSAVAVLAWAFTLRYLRRPWRRTHEGVHLMGLTVMVGLFCTLAVVTRVVGPYPYQQIVAAVLYTALLGLMGRQHWLLSDAERTPAPDAPAHKLTQES